MKVSRLLADSTVACPAPPGIADPFMAIMPIMVDLISS